MRKRQIGPLRFIIPIAASMLFACNDQEAGHVQVQVMPTSAATAANLYLGGTRLDFSRGSTVIMRFSVGQISLKTINSIFAPAICQVSVRKDRLNVVTVIMAET